jgi:hypothetical protein
MPSSEEEEEEHVRFKLNEFFRNYKPPKKSGFEKSDPTPETTDEKIRDFVDLVDDNKEVFKMFAQYVSGEKAGNSENAQTPSVFQLPLQPTIHLDSSYLQSLVLGQFSDFASGIFLGFVKTFAQYLIRKAMNNSEDRAMPSMTGLDSFKKLSLVKLWFTASDEQEAGALLKQVKRKIGYPSYELDSSRNLYLVGEFA